MDEESMAVTETWDFPTAPIPGGGMAVPDDALWVVNFGDDSVDRIDF